MISARASAMRCLPYPKSEILFLKQAFEYPAFSNAPSQWITIENVNVYLNPNIASSVIGKVPSEAGFNSLRETKYFIKVSFIDENGSAKKEKEEEKKTEMINVID